MSDVNLDLVDLVWEHQGRIFKWGHPEGFPNWLSFGCIEADSPHIEAAATAGNGEYSCRERVVDLGDNKRASG